MFNVAALNSQPHYDQKYLQSQQQQYTAPTTNYQTNASSEKKLNSNNPNSDSSSPPKSQGLYELAQIAHLIKDKALKMSNFKSLRDIINKLDSNKKKDEQLEDGQVTKHLSQNIHVLDFFGFILILTSNALFTITHYMEFHQMNQGRALVYLLIALGFSITACFINIMKQQQILNMMKTRQQVDQSTTLFKSQLRNNLIFETVITMLTPMPFLQDISFSYTNALTQKDIRYYYNDILHLFSLLRVLYYGLSIFSISVYKSDSSERICMMYGSEANSLFVIKCLMEVQPQTTVWSILIASILYFAHALRIAEAPLTRVLDEPLQDHMNYLNSVWAVILTMTTVGYGEIYPRTLIGRFIMFLCAMFGVIIVSMFVVTVMNTLKMGPLESKAFTVIKKMQLKKEMKASGAKVIGMFASLAIKRNRKQDINSKYLFALKSQTNHHQKYSRQYKQERDQNNTEEFLREFDTLKEQNKDNTKLISILLTRLIHQEKQMHNQKVQMQQNQSEIRDALWQIQQELKANKGPQNELIQEGNDSPVKFTTAESKTMNNVNSQAQNYQLMDQEQFENPSSFLELDSEYQAMQDSIIKKAMKQKDNQNSSVMGHRKQPIIKEAPRQKLFQKLDFQNSQQPQRKPMAENNFQALNKQAKGDISDRSCSSSVQCIQPYKQDRIEKEYVQIKITDDGYENVNQGNNQMDDQVLISEANQDDEYEQDRQAYQQIQEEKPHRAQSYQLQSNQAFKKKQKPSDYQKENLDESDLNQDQINSVSI